MTTAQKIAYIEQFISEYGFTKTIALLSNHSETFYAEYAFGLYLSIYN